MFVGPRKPPFEEVQFAPSSGFWPPRPCAPLPLAGMYAGPVVLVPAVGWWLLCWALEPTAAKEAQLELLWSESRPLVGTSWTYLLNHKYLPGTCSVLTTLQAARGGWWLGTVSPFSRGRYFSSGAVIIMHFITMLVLQDCLSFRA